MAKRNLSLGGAVPLDPGERDKAMSLEQLTEAPAASGFPGEQWTTLAAVVWARKRDMKGGEQLTAGQMSGAIATQWEIAYRADMDPDLLDVPKLRRVRYQGRIYDITTADVIGQREGIELLTIARMKTP